MFYLRNCSLRSLTIDEARPALCFSRESKFDLLRRLECLSTSRRHRWKVMWWRSRTGAFDITLLPDFARTCRIEPWLGGKVDTLDLEVDWRK